MELTTKATVQLIDDLEKRISLLEQSLYAAKCQELANEAYSKRLNLLIHALNKNEVWEKKETNLLIVEKYLQEGLNLNLQDLNIIDIHRLPQRPLSKQIKKLIRPITFKLSNILEKQKVLSACKFLKTFNDLRKVENIQSVCVTEQLPKLFQAQKKSLFSQIKKAKIKKLKTAWQIVNGSYCLFVENDKFAPPPCHSDKESNESSESEICSRPSSKSQN